MAQQVQVLLTDDVDGTEASETVSFSLDGVSYELDLSDANSKKFREALSEWTKHARKTGGRAKRGTGSAAAKATSAYSAQAVRKWAESNGVTVPERGRIPNTVLEQYRAAGN